MSEVIVERHYDPPLTDADLRAMIAMGGDCLGIHRVQWCGSALSLDGAQLVCHFRSADAESVRLALRRAGESAGCVWTGEIHDAPGVTPADLAEANVMVTRRFDAPADVAALRAAEQAGGLAAQRVHFLRCHVSIDRRRMVCLYRAPDAASVRLAQREAGLPVEQVFAVRRFAT